MPNETLEKIVNWIGVGGFVAFAGWLATRKKRNIDIKKTEIEIKKLDADTINVLRVELNATWDLVTRLRQENEEHRKNIHEQMRVNKKLGKDLQTAIEQIELLKKKI